jgi:hypothetical protein
MGASEFFTAASGKTVKEAFRSAIEEAQYESGHGGYTGTIAEKDSFVSCSNEVFQSYEAAINYAEDLVISDDKRIDDKFGPAGYVKFMNGSKTNYLFFGWASC